MGNVGGGTNVKEHSANYFYTQDQFKKWLEVCCEQGPDKREATTVLWKSWQIWTKENQVETGTETSFSENLSEAGFRYDKNLKGPDGKVFRGWRGLRIARDEGGVFAGI
jgi:phage/plasmid-associated DNA primase